MAGATQQSRLVKCPNCKKILQEPEDVPAYKCGECDTVLRVKTRKTDQKAESISDETPAAQKDQSVLMAIGLSSGEYFPDQKYQRDYYYEGTGSQYKGAYIKERSSGPQETPRRDKFTMICDSEMHMQATNSGYSMYGRPIRNWISQGRDNYMSPTCISPKRPSTSASPFHPSYVSTPETHQRRSYQRSYARLGWTHETNFSQTHFMVETPERRYLQALGQSPLPAFVNQGNYSPSFYGSYYSGAATSRECQYTGYHTPIRVVNEHVKESTRMLRRHLRPAKGGAPFVTCYYCVEVLQVPQHFLVSKKKLHLLRCGGCYGVLKLLRKDRTHTVVPHTPRVLDSLPSHGSDSAVKDINLALVGNESENGGAISCSDDDSGGYFSRGCSLDGDRVCHLRSNDFPINRDSAKISLDATRETPEFYLKHTDYKSEVIREPLGLNEMVGEMSGVYLGKPQNDDDKRGEVSKLDEIVEDRLGDQLKRFLEERSETLKPSETIGDEAEPNIEESGTQCENLNENFEEAQLIKHKDKPLLHLEESIKDCESSSEELEWGETEREKPEFPMGEYRNEKEMSCEEHGAGESVEERLVCHSDHIRRENEESIGQLELVETAEKEEFHNERENSSEKLEDGEILEEKPVSDLKEIVNEIETSSHKLEPGETMEERPMFNSKHIRSDSGNSSESLDEKPESHFREFINECEILSDKLEPGETMEKRPVFLSKHIRNESENSSEKLECGESWDEKPTSCFEEFEKDDGTSYDKLEPSETMEEQPVLHSKHIRNDSESSSEKLVPGGILVEQPLSYPLEFNNAHETSTDKLEPSETMEEQPVFHLEEMRNESESSSQKLEFGGNLEKKPASYSEEFENDHVTSNDKLEPSETAEEQLVFHPEPIRNEREYSSEKLEHSESLNEKPESQFGDFMNDCEILSDKLDPGVTMEERPVFLSKHIRNESENSSGKLEFGENLDEKPASYFEATEEQPVIHSKHIRNENENSSEKPELSEILDKKPASYFLEFINDHEPSIGKLEPCEITEEQPLFHLEEMRNEDETSSKKLEFGENLDKKPVTYPEEFENDHDTSNDKLEPSETVEEQQVFHPKHLRNESEYSSEKLETDEILDVKPVPCFQEFINDHEKSIGKLELNVPVLLLKENINEDDNQSENLESSSSKSVGDRPALHLDEYENKKGNSRESLKLDETTGNKPMFNLEKSENESHDSNESLDMEEEAIDTMFQLELSQDMQMGSRETPESKDESGKSMEESLSFHLEPSQNENKSSTEAYDPYSQLYEEVDPSEVVGLRQALYPMQGSPLRSPFASPLHSPIGSPIRYQKGSSLQSPIVSPFRSPIGSPTSTNGLLFFSK